MNTSLVRDIRIFASDPVGQWNKIMNWREESNKFHTLEGTFMMQEYGWLAEGLRPNTTVLDLGANIGDTPIYFAIFPQVNKVYAYELLPSNYKLAIKYINKTPFLKKKITMYNKGVSPTGRPLKIKDTWAGDVGAGQMLNESEEGVKVKMDTLKEALKGKKNVIIKCDIEGSEKYLFENVDLSNVYRIQIEWHGEDSEKGIKKVLKAQGFKVKAVEGYPGKSNLDFTEGRMVYAEKIHS